jgi:AraC-like DNA-binding protein
VLETDNDGAGQRIDERGQQYRAGNGPPQLSFERRVTSLRILTEFGVERGVSAHALLAGTGMCEEQLADPAWKVSGRQELRLIRNMVERLAHVPALGLEVGQRYHFTAFGALGLAIASSPTLRSALDLGQRFSELTFGFARVAVEDTVRDVRVTMDDSLVPADLRRFIIECTTAVMLTVARDLAPSDPPLVRVCLRYPAPPDAAPYERFYGMTPVFRSPANLLVLDRKCLERLLPLANEHALYLSERECERLVQVGRSRTGLAAKVRDRLEARIERMPSMDEVADDLHLTSRTLRRRLQEEGTTFVALRDNVRMTLAEQLLMGPRLSIQQIAERLDYADATSFINAFIRCRGRSPRSFRLETDALRNKGCINPKTSPTIKPVA